MVTTRLYQSDVYTRNWVAKVAISKNEDTYTAEMDRSAFFPEGGGQSCDTGKIKVTSGGNSFCFDVTDVQEDGERVLHTLKPTEPAEVPDDILEKELAAECSLDWDRRFDNMQRHCGEHILSGIFYAECGGVNRGFHMGEDYMTIDISLEDEPTNPDMSKPEVVDDAMALHCELLANRVIWSNAPVTVMRFDTREEAEKLPLRKKLAFDEDISIVCVGSPENAADCVACCGTHPATAGQVGLIKIFKVENYKSMFRIYCEAGQRALRDYDMKHSMLTDLSNSYSSSIEDFPSKIRAQEEKIASLKDDLTHAKRALTDVECAGLDEMLAVEEGKVVVQPLQHFTMDDAFNMAKRYMGKPTCCGKLILLYSVKDTSYILVSEGDPHCGQLVKEYANFYNGKGGGNDTSARAIFTNEEDAALFADLLKKHLQ